MEFGKIMQNNGAQRRSRLFQG